MAKRQVNTALDQLRYKLFLKSGARFTIELKNFIYCQ